MKKTSKGRSGGGDEGGVKTAPVVDLAYIVGPLRGMAERCDSLVMDPFNVKDHGDIDLPAHAASLREFGIHRPVVVRRENRQILIGNGTVLAAIKNGWEFVPVLFVDDDSQRAKARALADNAVGVLAPWNEINLSALGAELDLFFDENLKGLAELVEMQIGTVEEADETESTEEPEVNPDSAKDVTLSRRVIAVCKDEEAQIALLKELSDRGYEVRLSTVRVV